MYVYMHACVFVHIWMVLMQIWRVMMRVTSLLGMEGDEGGWWCIQRVMKEGGDVYGG